MGKDFLDHGDSEDARPGPYGDGEGGRYGSRAVGSASVSVADRP